MAVGRVVIVGAGPAGGATQRCRQLPQPIVNTIDIYRRGRRRARLAIESLGFIPRFIAQPAVLDVIRAGDRVVGVQADGSDGPREFGADLVIGTDGRYSTIRLRGGFTEPRSPQHFDVLNFLVPFPDFWPDRTTVRLELGPGCLTGGIPTADGRLWVGMTIQKGRYRALRAAGSDGLTGMPEIVATHEHQRKQTQTFLRSDRLSSRLAM